MIERQFQIKVSEYTTAQYRAKRVPVNSTIILTIAIGYLVFENSTLAQKWGPYFWIIVFIASMTTFIIVHWVFKQIFRYQYVSNEIFNRPTTVQIFDDRIKFISKNGQSDFRFGELKKIINTKDLILIYPTTNFFHCIPKRVLNKKEEEKINAYAK